MDEILIEDKKYVSSKQAAKMTGYAKDYIGQLCREGRVPARFVGRNWYVLESAIQDHRFGTDDTKPKKSVQTNPVFPKPDLIKESPILPPTWESPRYAAMDGEVLPSVNRLHYAETPKTPHDEEKEKLQDSWQEWFDKANEHTDQTEQVVPTEEPQEEQESLEEPPQEEEKEIPIPIRTVYQLSPEESLPRRTKVESALEHLREADEMLSELGLQKEIRPREKGEIRAIQVASILFATITATIAVVGTGYFDKYIISSSQVRIFAGVSLYNK